MGVNVGGHITTAGIIAGEEQDNRLRGQQMYSIRQQNADAMRRIRNEEYARKAFASRVPRGGNPVQKPNLPPLGVTSMPGGRQNTRPQPLPDQRFIPGQQPRPGFSPMVPGAPTGVHTGGFNQLRAAPRPGQDPIRQAQMTALRQQMGHGLTPVGPPQISMAGPMTPPGVPQSNPNPQPVADQTLGGPPAGVSNMVPGAQQSAPVVQNTGVGAPAQVMPVGSQAPAMAQPAFAPSPQSSPITQEWSATASPERHNIATMDRAIEQMEASYQQALPYAEDPQTAEYLLGLRGQMVQASMARNQAMLNDSFTELATGNPGRATQVLNGMGYNLKFSEDASGRIHMRYGNSKKDVVSGLPHEVATYLRIQFNTEFQKSRMEHQMKMQLEQLKIQGSLQGEHIKRDSSIKSSAVRGIHAARESAKRPVIGGANTDNPFIIRGDDVHDIVRPPEEEARGGYWTPPPYQRHIGRVPTNVGSLPPRPGTQEFQQLFGLDTPWPPQ